jgi:hypothetical protein
VFVARVRKTSTRNEHDSATIERNPSTVLRAGYMTFFSSLLGGAAPDAFRLRTGAAKVIEGKGLFHPTLVEIVANLLAFHADKIDTVDAFVNLLAIEHASFQFVHPNSQQLFVVLFDFASASLVTWKVLVVDFIVTGLIEVTLRPLGWTSCGFLLGTWHFVPA